MDGFIILVTAFAALVLFAVLAIQYGVDSRVKSTDPRHSPSPVGLEL